MALASVISSIDGQSAFLVNARLTGELGRPGPQVRSMG
jgi:hypothetical protein